MGKNFTFRHVELSNSVQTETKGQEGGVQQSPETEVKERVHKKRKEKPREGTSKRDKCICNKLLDRATVYQDKVK